jgi:site-specific DNA-methyltransferase (adenine-specific)
MIINGDCLEKMDKLIEQGVIVDAIITDPPYGTTACKWDSVIPFEPMWERLNKLIKPNGAVVLFGSEPFSSALRMSNIKNYKYDWKWEKSKPSGHLNAKKQPMRLYEDISVFYKKQCRYNPQGLIKNIPKNIKVNGNRSSVFGKEKDFKTGLFTNYPNNRIFEKNIFGNNIHPTQKPVALMEYLIKTYTNEGETVLDFTMGSGTTGVACRNLNRKFIGIELDDKYFEIAKERINN